jgi:hypothetical protein
MKRAGFVVLLALATAGTASAQERGAGAGRFEVTGFPAGGTFFTKGSDTGAPAFKNYALGASATVDLSKHVGVEGEIGGGVGFKQSMTINQTVVPDVKGPNTLAYNANIVFDPTGKNRSIVPYGTAGIGGMTLYSRTELVPLGLPDNEHFFTSNLGGGVKWFSTSHWGVRGDYRFIIVNGKEDTSPFIGLNETRYGHRVYGSLLYTFGK